MDIRRPDAPPGGGRTLGRNHPGRRDRATGRPHASGRGFAFRRWRHHLPRAGRACQPVRALGALVRGRGRQRGRAAPAQRAGFRLRVARARQAWRDERAAEHEPPGAGARALHQPGAAGAPDREPGTRECLHVSTRRARSNADTVVCRWRSARRRGSRSRCLEQPHGSSRPKHSRRHRSPGQALLHLHERDKRPSEGREHQPLPLPWRRGQRRRHGADQRRRPQLRRPPPLPRCRRRGRARWRAHERRYGGARAQILREPLLGRLRRAPRHALSVHRGAVPLSAESVGAARRARAHDPRLRRQRTARGGVGALPEALSHSRDRGVLRCDRGQRGRGQPRQQGRLDRPRPATAALRDGDPPAEVRRGRQRAGSGRHRTLCGERAGRGR